MTAPHARHRAHVFSGHRCAEGVQVHADHGGVPTMVEDRGDLIVLVLVARVLGREGVLTPAGERAAGIFAADRWEVADETVRGWAV